MLVKTHVDQLTYVIQVQICQSAFISAKHTEYIRVISASLKLSNLLILLEMNLRNHIHWSMDKVSSLVK